MTIAARLANDRVASIEVLRDAPGADRVLSSEALGFLATLQSRFGPAIAALMAARERAQARWDAGDLPDFAAETAALRAGNWKAAPIPEALRDRRVEITGPVDRKMIINALNSGAKVFMADFEDASSPTFANMIAGQANLIDARANVLAWDDPATGKAYRVGATPAVLIVRPRGLHLAEAHVVVDGQPMAASLFDFGLHVFHNGAALAETGRGPFYYLPKLQTAAEAALWNAVFVAAQTSLGLPIGTIKATVLIETLPATFEMDEIIHALRDHIAGLNCGRWDYIFSYVKTLRAHPDRVLPDRSQVGMDRAFLRAYAARLVEVCHRRGVHAMGGMAAQIPVRGDAEANELAFAKVRADKRREAKAGHDGTWVAHPDLVPVAMAVFDAMLDGPNQIEAARPPAGVTRDDLLAPHCGRVTEMGLRANVSVGVRYVAAWLTGRGAVPLDNLMEDAATAEISRVQIWQWLRHGAAIETPDGGVRKLDRAWLQAIMDEEIASLRRGLAPEAWASGCYDAAAELFARTATADPLTEFLTLPAYEALRGLA